ncbi:unnamed protein product [Prorocentrum cordatum]|uniref:RRM domain-containing protein n=1 Tax=Prorocentrum cordatum TaxID=2364126 RepID=A0ABN9V1M3_9DINO|nr:unnamed protein product [Polarella glacialis]
MGWPAHLDKGMFCEVFISSTGPRPGGSAGLPDTKGFGFCCAFAHLASQEEAAAAIKRLDGQDVSVEGAGGGVQDWSPAPRVNHTGALRGGVARSSNKLTVRYASRDQSPTHELV